MSCTPTAFFPASGKPCPPVLTEAEVIELLRLNEIDVHDKSGILRRYREAGRLRAVQISKRIFYRLESVLEFIQRQEEAVQR